MSKIIFGYVLGVILSFAISSFAASNKDEVYILTRQINSQQKQIQQIRAELQETSKIARQANTVALGYICGNTRHAPICDNLK